jgi:hypothetical protein
MASRGERFLKCDQLCFKKRSVIEKHLTFVVIAETRLRVIRDLASFSEDAGYRLCRFRHDTSHQKRS